MQPEFFRRAQVGSSSGAADLKNLDRTVAALATLGHSGVMDYPIGVFFAAVELANDGHRVR